MTADDGTHGREIWVSDGTAPNTNLLLEINSGTEIGASIDKRNVLCAEQLFFFGNTGNGNFEPWVTDGTAAGTQLIEEINPSGPGILGETFYAFNNKIYFGGTPGTPVGVQLFVMDANNCILSVAETNSFEFKVYPNPTKNIINIETTAEISKIEIYNTLGQLINSFEGNKKEIDVSTLSNGIYFLTITTTDKNSVTKKIIIE